MSPAFIAIAVTLVVIAVVGAVVALTDDGPRAAGRRALPVPASWIAVGAVLLVVGVVLMPRLLGFTFLFLPLIWSRRARGSRGPGRNGPADERERDPFDEDR